MIAPANRLIDAFEIVVATQDWHPAEHASFVDNHAGRAPYDTIELAGLEQILWPVHCVQGTGGAEFAAPLQIDQADAIIRKGTNPSIDSYSGFFDNGRLRSTGLAGYLNERGVDALFICGLATDYCVKFTAIDAITAGFRTHLVSEACRGVELTPGDTRAAAKDMQNAGVQILATVDESLDLLQKTRI